MDWVAAFGLLFAVFAVIAAAALLASDINMEVTLKREQKHDTIRICVTALYGLVRRQVVVTGLMWDMGGVKVKWRTEKGKSPTRPQADSAEQQAHSAEQGDGDPGRGHPGPEREGSAPAGTLPQEPGGSESKELRTATIDMKKMMEGRRRFPAILKATRESKQWMAETARKVRCSHLVWVTRIGLGDAAESALAAGMVWAVKAPVVGWFTRFVRMQRMPQLAVVPLFNETYFEMDFTGAFHIRLSSAIGAVVRLVWRAARVQGGLRRWWNALKERRAKKRRKERTAKERMAGEASS